MSGISIPVLATSVFLTAFSAFGAGYLMSPAPVRTGDSRPIIDLDAWNKTAPVQPGFQAQATPAQVEVAMDAAADENSQRGWVQPETLADAGYQNASYQNEIGPIDVSDSHDLASYAVEPLEGAGANDDQGTTTIMVLGDADADRAWNSAPTATKITATTISAN